MKAPTRKFLDELRERARRYGWSGDYVEIERFVRVLHEQAGVVVDDLDFEPIDDEEDPS